jgi:hypothetical protein
MASESTIVFARSGLYTESTMNPPVLPPVSIFTHGEEKKSEQLQPYRRGISLAEKILIAFVLVALLLAIGYLTPSSI